MEMAQDMTLGQIVDFVIEYNKVMDDSEKAEDKPKIRKATQADWDSFFGG